MSGEGDSVSRANVRFLSGDGYGDEPSENPGIYLGDEEEPELELTPPTPRPKAKGKGMATRTIVMIGVGFLVFVVAAGAFIYVLMQKRMDRMAAEDAAYPAAQPFQPAIVTDDPRATSAPAGNPVPAPVGQSPAPTPDAGPAVGVASPVPVQQQVAPQAQPTQAASLIAPQAPRVQESPVPSPVAPAPMISPAQAQLAQPATPATSVAQDSKASDGKLEALNQRLAKVESVITALMPVVERLVQSEKTRAAAPSVASKPTPAPEKVAAAPVSKPEHKEQKPAPDKEVAAPAKPAVQKGKSAPKEEAIPQVDLRGYGVSSLVGNRAWIVRPSSDGSDVEMSVSPGEVLEGTGRTVVSVDGKSKRVCLDNGQCIDRR